MTYIVMTSSARVAGKAKFGRYRNVAVVHTDGTTPTMISPNAKGVIGIARHWGACSVGKTERCEYARALAEANELAARLNVEAGA